MKRATYASATVAGLLILCKAVAWLYTDSVSMLATLIDSCLDALASLLNLLAVRHALSPADREHRFGHGKAEALSGLGQAMFIAGSALFLALEALRRLWAPQPVAMAEVGIAVMLFSIVITLALVAYQSMVVRKTGSTAIRADSLHYRTDLLINASVLVSLLCSAWLWPGADALAALIIVGFLLNSVREIIGRALRELMDHELSEQERAMIKKVVREHPEVRGMHDLRTRTAGLITFIQLHLELDDHLTLFEAHAISDDVEARLRALFPQAEILIHEDPASLMEQPTLLQRQIHPRTGGAGDE
ncbi:MAG: cation diffusion facilitator family transporter [Zetaproteobacteria bacterium]|nr:MAG: cation diffusion facilitator family transporter [Zetaproteobacteria bacterium]